MQDTWSGEGGDGHQAIVNICIKLVWLIKDHEIGWFYLR